MAACCPVCGSRLTYESFEAEGVTFGYAVCPDDPEHCGDDPNCGTVACPEGE